MKTQCAKPWRTGRLLAGLLTVLAVRQAPGAGAQGATNDAAVATDPTLRAAEAERAGRHADAVAAYEALLARDRTYESLVGPRLVALHINLGQAAQALAWAARVAARQPDPAAYLAGVHARLGQFHDAELALRESLGRAADPARRVPLLWQLADVQTGRGDVAAARRSLTQARDLTPAGAMRAAATERLTALGRQPTEDAPGAAAGPPGREATP